MTHEVRAVRQGTAAFLRCGVCRGSAGFEEGDFDGINAFVHEHKLCPDVLA